MGVEAGEYGTSVHWDLLKKEDYTDYFRDECRKLGYNPSESDVLKFFDTFGTHGYDWAVFGKRCSASTTMSGKASSEEMQEYAKTTTSAKLGYLWFQASEDSTQVESKGYDKNKSLYFETSNKKCIGAMTSTKG